MWYQNRSYIHKVQPIFWLMVVWIWQDKQSWLLTLAFVSSNVLDSNRFRLRFGLFFVLWVGFSDLLQRSIHTVGPPHLHKIEMMYITHVWTWFYFAGWFAKLMRYDLYVVHSALKYSKIFLDMCIHFVSLNYAWLSTFKYSNRIYSSSSL